MTFTVPDGWTVVATIDVHVAGEPLRVVTSGFPEPPGETMLQKRRHAQQHDEPLRRALMLEPRGHADMYGCILTSPVTRDGDFGVLFIHNEGYSTMCGHGIIGLVKAGLESGMIPASRRGGENELRIDTPAGRVVARADVEDGRVASVTFRNVPSFVLASDLSIDVPGLGSLRCDVAFGGAFYAYVNAADVDVPIACDHVPRLIDLGMRVKSAVGEALTVAHPDGDPDLGFVYGTIFVGPSHAAHSQNVCVFADGEVDRSPTGTGVSGRAAIHHVRGELALGESIRIESLIGSAFDVRVVAETNAGGIPAVVPEVTGTAHITGRHEFLVDPADPLREGFLLR